MSRVYLDTNILVAVADGVDVLGQLEEEYPHLQACVMERVMDELDDIRRTGTGKQKRAAKLAQQLISQQDLKKVSHSVTHVDDALLAAADKKDVIVTLDRDLQRRARKQGLRVLTIANHRLKPVA